MVTNILADINITSGASSSGSWATITGMSVSGITVQSTASVLILMFQMQIVPASDNTAEFRFNINGVTNISPVLTAFSDNPSGNDANSVTMVFAVDGLSGSSNTFAVEWRTVASSPAADTTRNRTFQILELVDNATLEVDMGTTGTVGDPSSWDDLFTSGSVSIAGTSSVIIMIANVPYAMAGDEVSDFQFAVDTAREGAVTVAMTDAANEGNGWSGVHCLDGLSAGTHTFHLQWQTITGPGETDSTRRRTFQVIEITSGAALKLDLISGGAGTATGSYTDVTGLSDSYVVAATSAMHLLFANIQIVGSSDSSADFMIGVDGVEEGAEILSYTDSTTLYHRLLLARVKTGLSNASHTFAARWLDANNTPSLDTARNRTFFAIEFTQVTYKREGFTKTNAGAVLGSVKCYLVKDNGDHTYTQIAYQLSNAVTGAYSFTGLPDNDPAYQVIGMKDNSPHVFDVTDHVLQPVAE